MTESVAAILFFFAVYSHMGWLLENSYSFFTTGNFSKPNFFKGPFKPMYGIAPILLIYFTELGIGWAAIIFLCFSIPTLVEYVSGFLLYKLFERRWWDYSNYPLQLHGHICLYFSLAWIVLSLIFLQWIHPAIIPFYQTIEGYWTIIYPAVILYFIVELIWAIWIHLPSGIPTGDQI